MTTIMVPPPKCGRNWRTFAVTSHERSQTINSPDQPVPPDEPHPNDYLSPQTPAHASMRGLDYSAVRGLALSAGRAVVTENAADFLGVLRYRVAAGQPAPTLIVTSNRTFPRHSGAFIGQAVRSLCAFCDNHMGADAAAGAVHWLQPIT